jgi:hypothetical protein
MLKGRSMERLAQRVASVIPVRPARPVCADGQVPE